MRICYAVVTAESSDKLICSLYMRFTSGSYVFRENITLIWIANETHTGKFIRAVTISHSRLSKVPGGGGHAIMQSCNPSTKVSNWVVRG